MAYDGTFYHGFARQKGVRTIEDTIVEVLKDYGLSYLDYASRTDKGVHAVSQLLLLEFKKTKLKPYDVLRLINSRLPTCITIHSFSRGTSVHRIRDVIKVKEYLYIAPDFGENPDILKRGISYINVKEHDFSTLSKESNRRIQTIRKINIHFSSKGDFQYFIFKGKGFLWEQVRRTVTFLKALALGRLEFNEFVDILNGKEFKKGIAPAPAGGLILWDIKTNVKKWQSIIDIGVIRKLILRKAEIYTAALSKSWVLP